MGKKLEKPDARTERLGRMFAVFLISEPWGWAIQAFLFLLFCLAAVGVREIIAPNGTMVCEAELARAQRIIQQSDEKQALLECQTDLKKIRDLALQQSAWR